MKLVTNKFKSGGLHEKHAVATWSLGNHLSIFVHVCPLIFRGLSPDSVITNQHIFLYFSYSFL